MGLWLSGEGLRDSPPGPVSGIMEDSWKIRSQLNKLVGLRGSRTHQSGRALHGHDRLVLYPSRVLRLRCDCGKLVWGHAAVSRKTFLEGVKRL